MFNEVVVSCNHQQASDFGSETIIVDKYHEIGPIGGLVTGLEHFDGQGIFVLSVDAPSVRPETMRVIVETENSKSIASIAFDKTNQYVHPLIGRWNQSAYPVLKNAIDAGVYSPTRILHANNFVKIEVDDGELFNVNEPSDFERYIDLIT
ncbi:MAG: hypothetical protein Salg2KO_20040 [Salibacteraceae bacterium]